MKIKGGGDVRTKVQKAQDAASWERMHDEDVGRDNFGGYIWMPTPKAPVWLYYEGSPEIGNR